MLDWKLTWKTLMNRRPKNNALLYSRRSGRRQELSLSMQLTWAIEEAPRLGVTLDASAADLQHMLDNSLHNYKSIRLDDGLTGADPNRPGFLALIDDALSDTSISHVLIHKRDRFARPQEAVEMVQIEKRLNHAGITLVFSDSVSEPYHPGQGGIERDIITLLAYSESGNYLNQLAERVILAHVPLAQGNFSTGGNAPYGHVRALFDPAGNFVEYLPKGRTVRQLGCHVRWVPGKDDAEQAKIRAWICILDLRHRGWGGKRIANHLNALGIPSPGAGTVRTDHGVKHTVSGKWGHGTVLDLCKNTTILGIKQYGRRAEGKHRRLAKSGWRLLDASDLNQDGNPKIVNNEATVIVEGRGESPGLYDEKKWQEIQADMQQRRHCQRGISRAKDPAKYPLRCRVVDMTNGCGAIIYGVQSSNRRLYKCGNYMRTSGDKCDNNSVDAEALLKFVMGVLRQCIGQLGCRDAIRKRLLEIGARDTKGQFKESVASNVSAAVSRVNELNSELERVRHNMAREPDESIYAALRQEYQTISGQINGAESALQAANASKHSENDRDPKQQVEAAMSLIDHIHHVTTDESARIELHEMLKRLGCRIGLRFVEAIKGKKRRVRKLADGVIVFGDRELPVPLHGDTRVDGGTPSITEDADPKHSCESTTNEAKKLLGRDQRESAGKGNHKPSPADTRPVNGHREGDSLTMVSRGDWI